MFAGQNIQHITLFIIWFFFQLYAMGNEIAVSTVTGDDLQVTAKLYNYYNLPLSILVYRIALCPNWFLQITFILHNDIHSAEICICQTGKDFREASWNSFFSGSQRTGLDPSAGRRSESTENDQNDQIVKSSIFRSLNGGFKTWRAWGWNDVWWSCVRLRHQQIL